MGFNDTWASASADGSGNEAPPPGIYEVALIDADAFVSKAGNEIAKLELRDVASGHEWTMVLGFQSQGAANFAKSAIASVGVDVEAVDSFDALGSALKEFVGRYYEVEVKQSGEYRNTYVRAGASPDVPAEMPEPAAVAGTDDDIPF